MWQKVSKLDISQLRDISAKKSKKDGLLIGVLTVRRNFIIRLAPLKKSKSPVYYPCNVQPKWESGYIEAVWLL